MTSDKAGLVLSGSIGKGHDSVAEACSAALASAGYKAPVLDCMKLLGGAGDRAGSAVFRRMLSIPPLYDAFHFSQLRAGGALAVRMEEMAAMRLVPRFRREIAQSGARLLVSVFATGAGALGRLGGEVPGGTSIVVCTDATAHRMWVHEGIDRYLVCSEMAAGTVRQYLPRADVAVIPPPVRPQFFDAPNKDEARNELGIDPEVPCALMMAGGWGMFPLEGAATALARRGYRVLAVAGANRRSRHKLDLAAETAAGRAAGNAVETGRAGGRGLGAARSGEGAGITVFGFTDRVPELMAAADAVVTSPGQTCHEARVVGRPLVVLDVVPGHGRENLLLELERGGALACTPRPASVAHAVDAVLDGTAPPPVPWPISSAGEWESAFLESLVDVVH